MLRIDTHHHAIPSFYRDLLRKAGIDEAGGRELPRWNPEGSLHTMGELNVATAILSVSTPGTAFLPSAADAAPLARDVNDYLAELVRARPDRFGFFATVPLPHLRESVDEVARSPDHLGADGVVLLANNAGTYLGQAGQEELFAALDVRSAVVLIHPGDLPGPAVDGAPPFAADFLLDTTRAAYLLVRNGIRRRYPHIKFILSHAGGFVPYASHRMAVAIMGDTGRSPGAVALPAQGITLATPHVDAPPAAPDQPRIVVSRTRPPAIALSVRDALGGVLVEMGSAGAKVASIVQGLSDVYVHAGGQFEWDSAAPVAVARAAGLHTSRIDGSALAYNQLDPKLPDVVVCRPELAAAVLAVTSVPNVE
ncbi:inositol monophosphatase family protein [Mycobacterium interjectum]|uniref:inositol monophosphatase family protein n=1 Tax=Mycobacterium interjectum TaxID=33895 RepID=UPI000A007FA6